MDWLRKVPIGQYVAGDSGWLRTMDPRLMMAWVVMFLVTPVLAGPLWRVGLVIALIALTLLSGLPLRLWWRSFCLIAALALFVGIFTMLLPTGENPAALSIRSPQELTNALDISPSWYLFDLGPFFVDRRSAELGLNTSTLIFTVIQSVNLMLLTKAPEDLVWTLRWFLSPLGVLGVPIDRISFQLLLSLRFLPLVQEELQNLLRSLSTRAVDIRKLGFKTTLTLFVSVAERLLMNILLRAEQGADALISKGGYWLPLDHLRPAAISKKRISLLNIGSSLLLLFVLSLRGKYGTL